MTSVWIFVILRTLKRNLKITTVLSFAVVVGSGIKADEPVENSNDSLPDWMLASVFEGDFFLCHKWTYNDFSRNILGTSLSSSSKLRLLECKTKMQIRELRGGSGALKAVI